MEQRRILELFSGIGGMHTAFQLSGLQGTVVAAIDINTVANTVYRHNHPDIKLLTSNIQKAVTPEFVREIGANTILMSPPCQPFTRTGKQQDVDDNRSDALVHICSIIGSLESVDAILMENVKGFETSQAREMYIKAIEAAGFYYQEFILSPSQLRIPNTRYRYYCLARKCFEFPFKFSGILDEFPFVRHAEGVPSYGRLVSDYLDPNTNELRKHLIPEAVLEKRIGVLDIAHRKSKRTMCFTKAYTHYTEGTGSVFSHCSDEDLQIKLKSLEDPNLATNRLENIRELQLRYFSPSEVARLMCFPVKGPGFGASPLAKFSFPKETTSRQRYRLLGNSINVYLVSVLLRILFDERRVLLSNRIVLPLDD